VLDAWSDELTKRLKQLDHELEHLRSLDAERAFMALAVNGR
jgi:hypothetical protein